MLTDFNFLNIIDYNTPLYVSPKEKKNQHNNLLNLELVYNNNSKRMLSKLNTTCNFLEKKNYNYAYAIKYIYN